MANLLRVTLLFFMRNCEATKSLRIWKGRDALPNEFPYVVRIELKLLTLKEFPLLRHHCTGSLIAPTWTLTAAHCADFSSLPEFKPVLLHGAVSRAPRKNDTTVDITAWFIHPSYDDEYLLNDIGLLKSEPIYLSKYGKVSGVHYKTLYGLEVKTVGYGIMSVMNGIELDTREMKKPLQVMTVLLKKCAEPVHARICLSKMCDSENVICGGDSGGPTIHWSGIVGVSSSSPIDCDNLDQYPDFDVVDMTGDIIPVSPYLEWIKSITSVV